MSLCGMLLIHSYVLSNVHIKRKRRVQRTVWSDNITFLPDRFKAFCTECWFDVCAEMKMVFVTTEREKSRYIRAHQDIRGSKKVIFAIPTLLFHTWKGCKMPPRVIRGAGMCCTFAAWALNWCCTFPASLRGLITSNQGEMKVQF